MKIISRLFFLLFISEVLVHVGGTCERRYDLIEVGRRCRKPCERNVTCTSPNKFCLCDGYCGMSCYNPEANYSAPDSIPHGSFIFTRNGRTMQSEAVYECHSGYFLSGNKKRVCRADKKWYGAAPTCEVLECGKAGDVASIKQQPLSRTIKRSVNAENANENSWPWQALITSKGATKKKSLQDDMLLGGGSIIGRKWILTAAHIFKNKTRGWMDDYCIAVGVNERPTGDEELSSTIQMFSMDDYVEHRDFRKRTFANDIALIKLGPEYDFTMQKNEERIDGILYGNSARPVCLPCLGTCITRKLLQPYINDKLSFEEKCMEEEKLLLKNDAKVVATGFGHMDKRKYSYANQKINLSTKLQQALLQIANDVECEKGIKFINARIQSQLMRYTDKMICCKSGDPLKTIDTCEGDSGGPVVREVINRYTSESCWVQIGIVSFGYGCGRDDIPGYYTNVAKYVSWINEKIHSKIICKNPPLKNNQLKIGEKSKWRVGETVVIQCERGFAFTSLNPSTILTCGGNDTWQGATTSCYEIICKNPPLKNNQLKIGDKSEWQVGETVAVNVKKVMLSQLQIIQPY